MSPSSSLGKGRLLQGRARWRHGFVAFAFAFAVASSARPAAAAPIVFEADVPASGPDHFFLELDVPAGIEEIEVRHDDLSDANILDFGLDELLRCPGDQGVGLPDAEGAEDRRESRARLS